MSSTPTGDFEAAGELFKVLSAPLRLGIVEQLASREKCVHELVDALDAAQPLISQHLRVLRAARVVRGSRRGREVAYEIADDHITHIVLDALTHIREDQP